MAAGKQRKKGHPTRDERLIVLLSSDEKTEWQALADAAGLSVSSWVRSEMGKRIEEQRS